MIITFRWRYNASTRQFRSDSKDTWVWLAGKSGEVKVANWRGLIDRQDAAALHDRDPTIRAVKIHIFGYLIENTDSEWVYLEPKQYIQGCYREGVGVKAVLFNGVPKQVSGF